MNRNLFHLILIVFLLTGCTMAPNYTRPETPVPAQWPTGAAYKDAKPSASALAATDLPWRDFFTDERLQKIIGITLDNNRDLRVAALNVERALALCTAFREPSCCLQSMRLG